MKCKYFEHSVLRVLTVSYIWVYSHHPKHNIGPSPQRAQFWPFPISLPSSPKKALSDFCQVQFCYSWIFWIKWSIYLPAWPCVQYVTLWATVLCMSFLAVNEWNPLFRWFTTYLSSLLLTSVRLPWIRRFWNVAIDVDNIFICFADHLCIYFCKVFLLSEFFFETECYYVAKFGLKLRIIHLD